MNQRLLGTIATLLTTALSTPSVGHAAPNESVPNKVLPATSTEPSPLAINPVEVAQYQPPTRTQATPGITRVQPHQLAGHMAATLYVRNIPVLTFLGSQADTIKSNKSRAADGNGGDVNSDATRSLQSDEIDFQPPNAPISEALAVADQINQLHLDGVDARKIAVSWQPGSKSRVSKEERGTQINGDTYLIKYKDKVLVELNAVTHLPDTTHNLEQDALQATNRLRRLLGNAPPLRRVADKPAPPAQRPKLPRHITFGSIVRINLSGLASWYGPGFHGNRSANGEVYNQHSLTAAHRSLPFGTRVRVTNVQNGRSVVVRITDRGPFIRGRIIDLSAAAARLVGLVQLGVAPVRVEVLSDAAWRNTVQRNTVQW